MTIAGVAAAGFVLAACGGSTGATGGAAPAAGAGAAAAAPPPLAAVPVPTDTPAPPAPTATSVPPAVPTATSAPATATTAPATATTAPAPTQTTAPAATATSAPAANAAPVVITMTDQYKFDPASVTIAKGTTVTWKIGGAQPHTVTFDPSKAMKKGDVVLPDGVAPFDSGLLSPGQSYSHTFTVAGEYSYICTPHEMMGMIGKIVVQ